MPLHRRIPKRGFHNPFAQRICHSERRDAQRFCRRRSGHAGIAGARAAWCASAARPIKILGDGNLKAALTVRAHAFSKSAEEKITRAGGKVERLS